MLPAQPVSIGAMRSWWTPLLIALCGACPDVEQEQPVDGGAQADAGTEVPWRAEPAEAAPPSMTPCPEGGATETMGEVTVCEPWPAGGWVDCAMGSGHFPGKQACEPLGRCPAGQWAEDLPDRGVVYVASGAGGGDGSRDRPFGTIALALRSQGLAKTIALAKGDYPERFTLAAGFTIHGACAAETIVGATDAADSGAQIVARANTRLEKLTVRGQRTGLVSPAGASVHLEDVAFERFGTAAILAQGGTVRGRRVVIRDGEGRLTGAFGRGLTATRGGTIEIEQIVIARTRQVAAWAGEDGATIVLRDAMITATLPQRADRTLGFGVQVENGGSVSIVQSVIDGNRQQGVSVLGGTMSLEDVVVRNTNPGTGDGGGEGVLVLDEGHLEARRVWLANNRHVGLFIQGSTAELEDVLVRGTKPQASDRHRGQALRLHDVATVTATRTALIGNRDTAVLVFGGSTLRAYDLIITDQQPSAAHAKTGNAMGGDANSVVEVHRGRFERLYSAGVFVTGGRWTLEDLIVRDVWPSEYDGGDGMGLALLGGDHTLTRAVVEKVRGCGVFVDSVVAPATFSGTDVFVGAVEHDFATGYFGRGMSLQDTTASLSRVEIEGGRDVGIHCESATVSASGLRVRHTRKRACVESHCPMKPMGIGMTSLDARVVVSDFIIEGNALAGFQVANGGTLDLSDGEVRGHPIGVNVQVDGFDYDRLTDGVRYTDNVSNLDAQALPLPDTSVPPATL